MIRARVGARMLATMACWAAIAALVGLVALLALPRCFGGQSFAVLSNSMKGSVNTGDEVIVMPLPASEIEVGEIVAFDDPEGTGKLFQHRVQRVERAQGQVRVITKGDANDVPEHWRVGVDEQVGRVVAVLPKVGYAVGRLSGPSVRAALLVVPSVLLAFFILSSIWRRPGGEVTGGA